MGRRSRCPTWKAENVCTRESEAGPNAVNLTKTQKVNGAETVWIMNTSDVSSRVESRAALAELKGPSNLDSAGLVLMDLTFYISGICVIVGINSILKLAISMVLGIVISRCFIPGRDAAFWQRDE